ncbi:MAG: right-handed parallel beta-helix repeat-containing protein, partial [Patescibacteria group bacterium]
YFTRLSREAVINGAGIIDLFLREGKKAKQNPDSLEKPPEETLKVSSLIDEFSAVFAVFSAVKEIMVSAIQDISSRISPKIVPPQTQLAVISPPEETISISDIDQLTVSEPLNSAVISEINLFPEEAPRGKNQTLADLSELQITLDKAKAQVATLEASVAEVESNLEAKPPSLPAITGYQLVALPYAGFGGGGSPPSGNDQISISNSQTNSVADTLAPNAPIIASPADFSAIFTDSAITFAGVAEVSSTVFTDFSAATTTAGQNNSWQMTLIFPQGTTTLNFFAQDADENISSSTVVVLFIDSIAPSPPSFSVAECQNSLAVGACLTATTTLSLSWSSAATDLNYFELSYGSIVSTTTATSAVLSLSDETAYNFSLRQRDSAGNWSEATTTTVEINTMPVVVNEAAWMGTSASYPFDEWLELYNRTNYNINLNNWVLFSKTDGSPYLNLNGSIPAKDYYLIERTDDNTISGLAADLISSFGDGLSNNGENIALVYAPAGQATTTIDEIPYDNQWFAGSDSNYLTMERRDSALAGTDGGNWGTALYNIPLYNSLNAGGAIIKGTPKKRNSVNYLIAKGLPAISENITLIKTNSPYLVNNIFQVFQSGATLTIEPGVVIKFYNDAGMQFSNAGIMAQGTTQEPIVFTSFYDDEYGGDTNFDATTTLPVKGSWFGVDIVNSASSTLNNVVFRYAGKYYTPTGDEDRTIVKIQNSEISIKNSIFEHSKAHGLVIVNSTSTVENSVFRNNDDYSEQGKGLLVSAGNFTIKNNTFLQNQTGLYLSEAPDIVDANTFASNTQRAIYSYGLLGEFTNNSASQNGLNGIVLDGNLASAGATSTLKADNLPYVISGGNPTVPADAGLAIESGAVIKGSGKGLQINGRLTLNGNNPEDIFLTSLYDDTVGGDTDNNLLTLPNPGDWPGITLAGNASLTGKGFTMRYAGSQSSNGQDSAGLKMTTSLASITNALFEKNYPYGIFALAGSNLNITNSRFENHNYSGPWGTKAALAVYDSTTTLNSVSFINNLLGIASNLVSTWLVNAVEFINNTATTSPGGLF